MGYVKRISKICWKSQQEKSSLRSFSWGTLSINVKSQVFILVLQLTEKSYDRGKGRRTSKRMGWGNYSKTGDGMTYYTALEQFLGGGLPPLSDLGNVGPVKQVENPKNKKGENPCAGGMAS